MTVDPITTPRELAAKYARFRLQVLNQGTGKLGKRLKRARPLSEKHAKLATFAVRHNPLDSKKMTVWNRQFPQWEYTRYSNFSRDAKVAKERLLHQVKWDSASFANPPVEQWSQFYEGARTGVEQVQQTALQNDRHTRHIAVGERRRKRGK
jgi:hypothetical protein